MTALHDAPATALRLPDSMPAAMDTALDEPLHGALVPLSPTQVLPGDYVLCGGESTGDVWLRVAQAQVGRVETVGGAVLSGDQVWCWQLADVLVAVALGECAGGAS